MKGDKKYKPLGKGGYNDTLTNELSRFGFSKEKIETSIEKYGTNLVSNLLNLLPITVFNRGIPLKKQLEVEGISIGKKIGEGSYGSVYECQIRGSSLQWTLKMGKDREDFQDSEVLESTVREMAYYFLFSIKQMGPHIPNRQPFFLDMKRGEFAIVTQHYTSDLNDLLKHLHTVSGSIRTHLYQEICQKLNHCINTMLLELGVFCIDMKPSNILVEWSQETLHDLVVTDFGVDFCCNTNVNPQCPFTRNHPNLLNKGSLSMDTFLYMKYLILFSLALTSFFGPGIRLFQQEMLEFRENIIDTAGFDEFLRIMCDHRRECRYLHPTFHYLFFYLEYNPILSKYVRELESLRNLKKKHYHLYLIKATLMFILTH